METKASSLLKRCPRFGNETGYLTALCTDNKTATPLETILSVQLSISEPPQHFAELLVSISWCKPFPYHFSPLTLPVTVALMGFMHEVPRDQELLETWLQSYKKEATSTLDYHHLDIWRWPENLQLTFASTFHRLGHQKAGGKEHPEGDEAVGVIAGQVGLPGGCSQLLHLFHLPREGPWVLLPVNSKQGSMVTLTSQSADGPFLPQARA